MLYSNFAGTILCVVMFYLFSLKQNSSWSLNDTIMYDHKKIKFPKTSPVFVKYNL